MTLDGEYLAHDWTDDGEREVGGERHRCARCGALRHWPIATDTCIGVLEYRAWETKHVPPLHEGQWPGPYGDGQLGRCVECARPFRRPKSHGQAKACGVACSQAVRRRNHTEKQRAARARKRAER